MDMPGSAGMSGALNDTGVDFSNETQAFNFLQEILDDTELSVIGNDYATYFWYGVVAVIAIAGILHWAYRVMLSLRLRAAAKNDPYPAMPRNFLTRRIATCTAITREVTYCQLTPKKRLPWLRVPPVGTIILILTHFIFIIVLEFANDDVEGDQFWEARGIRAGWLAVAQTPLLILLAGKNNLIGYITGVSYQRLNVLHRWTARMMLFLTIVHFGYQSYGWQQFSLMQLEWNTDTCPPTGIAAFALLLWMNLSTLAPLRYWSYEIFVVQHLVTFFGFIIAVMIHLPTTALRSRIYVYIPIGFYLLDRLIRTTLFVVFNVSPRKATLKSLEGGVTRVRISNHIIKNWSPGSFVLLSVPQIGWIESHPATIMSTPHSHNGDMIFLLQSQKGFTKRLLSHASSNAALTPPQMKQTEDKERKSDEQVVTRFAMVNNIFGGSQSDFAAYDSVLLIAGSTGITFVLSILQNIAYRATATKRRLPLRRLHLIWCIREVSCIEWCQVEISTAFSQIQQVGIEISISIHVTRSVDFTKQVLRSEDKVSSEIQVIEGHSQGFQGKLKGISGLQPMAAQSSILPCAKLYSGRPHIREVLTDLLDGAKGESAVGVCGPIGMSSTVRNSVVVLSDERAIHKGSGEQGCYLYVESFS